MKLTEKEIIINRDCDLERQLRNVYMCNESEAFDSAVFELLKMNAINAIYNYHPGNGSGQMKFNEAIHFLKTEANKYKGMRV